MSAYVANDNTFRAVLDYATDYDLRAFKVTTLDQLGQILVNENYRSVNHRYDETAEPHKFEYKPHPVSPLQAAKHIDCIDYQSCETNDWEHSDAFRLLARLRGNLLDKLAKEFESTHHTRLEWDAREEQA